MALLSPDANNLDYREKPKASKTAETILWLVMAVALLVLVLT